MLITFAVFATLLVISLAIFFVETLEHQRLLKQRNFTNPGSALNAELQPVMITTIRGGEMYESYYYMPEHKLDAAQHFTVEVEDSLFKNLVLRAQLFVN
ncbi:hypothetical protein PZB74_09445 [Porifericola rhodea]|uniref:hypothetical protein n=1 Tax=Porifericola rhodea TaxID=930972 RepID=UPI002665CA1B|nr:hypothetical protein [Porifericola rhodea]WKN33554.1 hypothetical protein PZB74_09445 [Porifericola rhodea]